jgi:hypothetical protein
MSANVIDSTFSRSGETDLDTHKSHKGTQQLVFDASASKDASNVALEKTFLPEGTGKPKPQKLDKESMEKISFYSQHAKKDSGCKKKLRKRYRKVAIKKRRSKSQDEMESDTPAKDMCSLLEVGLDEHHFFNVNHHFFNMPREVPDQNRKVIDNTETSGKDITIQLT